MEALKHVPRLRSIAAAACMLVSLAATGYAQSGMEKTLQQFQTTDVKGYIQPLVDLLGANMNAGMFHSAEIGKNGFHLSLDIVAMGSLVGDNQKNYMTTPSDPSVPPFSTATMFGGLRDSVLTATGHYAGTADGFVHTSIFPAALPQVTIGNLFGTRAIVRFMTSPSIGQFPSSTFWGIGVQHSVSQYIPEFPVGVAVHVFYNKATAGDLVNYSGMSVGAEASKSFSFLRLYGGLAWEKSSMEVKFTPTGLTSPLIDVTMDGANSFRASVGLGLHFGFFSIFGDANFSSITNFSAGIGFGI